MADRASVAALAWLVILAVAGLLAPLVAPHSPSAQDLSNTFAGSSWSHLLGTDDLGRDVLSRLVYGARVSMRVSVEVVGLALAAALPIGLVAGYRGGHFDNIAMRLMDSGLSFPPLVLALALAGVLGPGADNAALALAVVFVPGFARLVRGQTLVVKAETFVEASQALGTPPLVIVFRRVLPNVLSAVIVQVSLALGAALLAEAALSFLGLGAQPPDASWGSMLRGAYDTGLFSHPWSLVAPGAAIALAVLAFNTLGDGLAASLKGARTPRRRGRTHRARAGRLGITTVLRDRPVAATRETSPPVSSRAGSPLSPAVRRTTPATRSTGSSDDLLSVDGLTVDLDTGAGPVRAVDDVSLRLRESEVLGLVGESGSGKSLTSLAVMRLLGSPPATIVAGSVTFAGRDVLSLGLGEMRRVRGRDMAMVFQDPMSSLNPALRVGVQVAEAVRAHDRTDRRPANVRALELLAAVGIADHKARYRSYPHELSGGMRQRVMLAIALACRPRLLIADEPTTALDVTVQAQILELLRRLQQEEGMAVLLVTHDLGVVADLCDQVAVMYAGQIVERASVDDLFARPRHPYTEGMLASSPAAGSTAEPLAAIPGRVPPLGQLPGGCRFHPRCAYAIDVCRTTAPALIAVGDRLDRCHRSAELALRGAP